MKHATTAAIAAVLLIYCEAWFPVVAFAEAGRAAPSRPSPTRTCRACVLDLSSCLRRCDEQDKSTSGRLKCVNSCTEKQRCAKGITCVPDSS
jgi:hypothetical protein